MEGFKNRPDANSQGYQRFRHRPHANPLSDCGFTVPCTSPEEFPFANYYKMQQVPDHFDLVDIGCGYGDFVKNMAILFPQKSFIGLELRDKAVAIAQQQLLDARQDEKCNNAIVIRCNAMRQLPFILPKAGASVITIMFPDPQFKNSNEKRRIVSTALVSEYAYYLKQGGYLLTCTDVKDLSEYIHQCIALNGNFIEDEVQDNFVVAALQQMDHTADADRHQRKDEDKRVFKAIWKKI